MSPQLQACETEALKLPPGERAVLAEHLLASLDSLDAIERERLWIEEAGQRYTAYKQGSISTCTAQEALSKARSAL